MSRIKTARELEIESKAREHLRAFPLYDDSHWLGVMERGPEHVCIGYGPTPSRMHNEEKTQFDLEIKGTRGDVLFIGIEKGQTKRGYGRSLYHAIEGIAKELGCSVIQTTPSGEGNVFWQKMGFNTPCLVGFEKPI